VAWFDGPSQCRVGICFLDAGEIIALLLIWQLICVLRLFRGFET
jgi:hypothetical protein